jgi:hypothetical protein
LSRILITSGPTRQYLDLVRYLMNAASGRMGNALAEAAVAAGRRLQIKRQTGIKRKDPQSTVGKTNRSVQYGVIHRWRVSRGVLFGTMGGETRLAAEGGATAPIREASMSPTEKWIHVVCLITVPIVAGLLSWRFWSNSAWLAPALLVGLPYCIFGRIMMGGWRQNAELPPRAWYIFWEITLALAAYLGVGYWLKNW